MSPNPIIVHFSYLKPKIDMQMLLRKAFINLGSHIRIFVKNSYVVAQFDMLLPFWCVEAIGVCATPHHAICCWTLKL